MVDVLVDGLDKVAVHLFGVLLLLRPVKGVGLIVDAVNVLVVPDEGLDGIGGELESDLVAQDHIDVDDIRLDGYELVVKEGLGEGVGVLAQLGLGGFSDHDRGEGPDGVFRVSR